MHDRIESAGVGAHPSRWPRVMFESLRGKSGNTPMRPRAAERFQVVGMTTPLGEVVDLSCSGIRVRFAGKCPASKGQTVSLQVSNDCQSVKVTAMVAWIRARALRRGGEMGLRFVNVRPGVAAALVQLGRFGHISTSAGLGEDGEQSACPSDAPPVVAVMEVEDLYAVLGVEATCSQEDIRDAYHALAKELHPDLNASAEAAQRFSDVAKAYRVLRTPESRRKYDELVARCSRKAA